MCGANFFFFLIWQKVFLGQSESHDLQLRQWPLCQNHCTGQHWLWGPVVCPYPQLWAILQRQGDARQPYQLMKDAACCPSLLYSTLSWADLEGKGIEEMEVGFLYLHYLSIRRLIWWATCKLTHACLCTYCILQSALRRSVSKIPDWVSD